MLKVQGNERFCAYAVDHPAIVATETIDPSCALTRTESEAQASIARTYAALDIGAVLR